MWDKVVVLGASGPTGRALVDELLEGKAAKQIVLTSRSGKIKDLPPNDGILIVEKFDILQSKDALIEIAKGASVLFCCIGLPRYEGKVWAKQWPVIGERIVSAAEENKAALVFMDNLYCFGPEGLTNMTEGNTEYSKTTKKKPKVRVALTKFLLQAHQDGRCKVALVRASDFFGPRVVNSGLGSMVFGPMVTKKSPTVLGNPHRLHSYTYVPDIARALVAVAKDPEAYGRAWHVPNAPAVSTVTILDKIGKLNNFKKKPSYTALNGLLLSALSLFMTPVNELKEMKYGWVADYVVHHSEFSARFPDVTYTPLDDALKATNDWYIEQSKSSKKM